MEVKQRKRMQKSVWKKIHGSETTEHESGYYVYFMYHSSVIHSGAAFAGNRCQGQPRPNRMQDHWQDH